MSRTEMQGNEAPDWKVVAFLVFVAGVFGLMIGASASHTAIRERAERCEHKELNERCCSCTTSELARCR